METESLSYPPDRSPTVSCTPSYSTEYLPINPGLCGQKCRNCAFNAVVATSCTGDACNFSWTVSRTSCTNQTDEDFIGSATIQPGDSRQVDFYCDPAESCARFRLTLTCKVESTAPLPQD